MENSIKRYNFFRIKEKISELKDIHNITISLSELDNMSLKAFEKFLFISFSNIKKENKITKKIKDPIQITQPIIKDSNGYEILTNTKVNTNQNTNPNTNISHNIIQIYHNHLHYY